MTLCFIVGGSIVQSLEVVRVDYNCDDDDKDDDDD